MTLALALIMALALLTGCMAEVIDTTLNPGGAGTYSIKVGFTEEVLEQLKQSGLGNVDISEYKTFEYNGVTYYGQTREESFSSLDELNSFYNTLPEEMEEYGSLVNGCLYFSENDDGSYNIALVKTAASVDGDGETVDGAFPQGMEELMEDGDFLKDMEELIKQGEDFQQNMEELLEDVAIIMNFTMPGQVRQLSGPTQGVTIEGSLLTFDMVAMGKAEEFTSTFTTSQTLTELPAGAFPGGTDELPAPSKVAVSSQPVTVNGENVSLQAYNIDGSNYFKLRDLAKLLDGTASQFEVVYDKKTRTVVVTTGESYTALGNELTIGEDQSSKCVPSTQSVTVDGEAVSLSAYNIGGHNYVKLRDLGKIIGFHVDYDNATRVVSITTAE